MNDVNIRDMRDDDRTAILACMSELLEAERAIDARMLPAHTVVKQLLAELIDDCGRYGGGILVAATPAGVVGYVGVLLRVPNDDSDEIDYRFAQISDLAVLSSHRSRGIGRALLEAARHKALGAGARWLRINVLADNSGARRLYRQIGFREREVILEQSLQSEQQT